MDNVNAVAGAVLDAARGYSDPAASDEAVDAAVGAWGDAMERLAGLPAATADERRAKARALQTALLPDGGIAGDQGLAASLIRDVLAA